MQADELLASGRFELARILLGEDAEMSRWVVDAIEMFAFWNRPALLAAMQRRVGYPSTSALVCQLPPRGWWCTRQPGHPGPCAALPPVQTYECPYRGRTLVDPASVFSPESLA